MTGGRLRVSSLAVRLLAAWCLCLAPGSASAQACPNATSSATSNHTKASLAGQQVEPAVSAPLQLEREAGAPPSQCGPQRAQLDRCSAQLIGLGVAGSAMPTSMAQMDSSYCPRMKRALACVKASMGCYSRFERQVIDWVLSSSKRTNSRRCRSEPEKAKFLRLSQSCLGHMQTPMDRCMANYVGDLESIANLAGAPEPATPPEHQIQLSCCANRRFKSCMMAKARQLCRPADELLAKLRRTNSLSAQSVVYRSMERSQADAMSELGRSLEAMALTGPEFICGHVKERFCRLHFEARFTSRLVARHSSIVPAMIRIYAAGGAAAAAAAAEAADDERDHQHRGRLVRRSD